MKEGNTTVEGDGRYLVATIESAGEVSPVFQEKLDGMAEELFGDVDAEKWYPFEKFNTFFHELGDEIGDKTLHQAGTENGKAIPFSDDIDSPGAAFNSLNDLHKQATRGSEQEFPIGRYTVTKQQSRQFRVGATENFPHPEPYAEGVLFGIVKSFTSEGTQVSVESVDPNRDERYAWSISW